MRNQKMQERVKSKPFQDMESVVITTANLGSLRTSILQRAAISLQHLTSYLPQPYLAVLIPRTLHLYGECAGDTIGIRLMKT